ncbi:hypothetical protein GGP46_003062 [Salinibacter ruber]|nr:hypothetical protein [Salinibacter ruber]
METAALSSELFDVAALFVTAACPFLCTVTWRNPMHLPNLRQPNGRD